MSAQLEDSAYIFDAVWAAALALNDISVANFTYNSLAAANVSQSIYEKMMGLNFFGLTVSMHVSNS